MKTLIKLVTLLTLSFTTSQAMALEGLDIKDNASMKMLGKIYACELHFAERGEQVKSDVIGIATSQEFEADWNVMRNEVMHNAMIESIYKLNNGSVKGLEACNKAYKFILSKL